jgi:ribonuclease HII
MSLFKDLPMYKNPKEKKEKTIPKILNMPYSSDERIMEIGIDEAGRGPLFGRVYAGAVILPKNSETFNYSLLKDSKKFTSKKKITEVSNYIKENSIAWSVEYVDEDVIDEINILQATQKAMHKAIKNVLNKLKENDVKIEEKEYKNVLLLVDGNYFNNYFVDDNETNKVYIQHYTVEQGDGLYGCIAAASILAKVERDLYIDEMCKEYPKLDEYYSLSSNKGYGAAKHRDGISKYGISPWHRKTFGICNSSFHHHDTNSFK